MYKGMGLKIIDIVLYPKGGGEWKGRQESPVV
jgi:hypothetical protein